MHRAIPAMYSRSICLAAGPADRVPLLAQKKQALSENATEVMGCDPRGDPDRRMRGREARDGFRGRAAGSGSKERKSADPRGAEDPWNFLPQRARPTIWQ
jgi:hypothetical protein